MLNYKELQRNIKNDKERPINLKVNLNNLSQRAQSFIKTPQYFKDAPSSDFLVTINDDDRILTVTHGKKADEIEFILAEIVAKFSENKNFSEIWKINFREIESFLRDENHLPAFTGDTHEVESALIHIKAELIGSALKAKFKNQLEWIISQRKNWNQITLTAKNEWAQTLIRPLGWDLVFCEGDVLTVSNTPPGVDGETLSLLINVILSGGENFLPMKVVAV